MATILSKGEAKQQALQVLNKSSKVFDRKGKAIDRNLNSPNGILAYSKDSKKRSLSPMDLLKNETQQDEILA